MGDNLRLLLLERCVVVEDEEGEEGDEGEVELLIGVVELSAAAFLSAVVNRPHRLGS